MCSLIGNLKKKKKKKWQCLLGTQLLHTFHFCTKIEFIISNLKSLTSIQDFSSKKCKWACIGDISQ